MKQRLIYQFSILSLVGLLLTGCKSTYFVPDDQFLLQRNKVELTQKSEVNLEELEMYIKQKPNKAIFFDLWRIYLTSYNLLHNKKDETNEFQNKKHGLFTRFRLKSVDALGEAPVVLDTTKIPYSIIQMQSYLRNKGYYHSKITYQIKYKGRKKAKVIYTVTPGEPFRFHEIKYNIPQSHMKKLYMEDSLNTLIRPGKKFDIGLLSEERTRLSTAYQNRGYFDFNEYFIRYQIDSTIGNNKVNVTISIDPPYEKLEESDSVIQSKHKRYRIRNIYVQTDYNVSNPNLPCTDTLIVQGDITRNTRRWTLDTTMLIFVFRDTLKYKPTPIYKAIYFRQNKYYRLSYHQETFQQLSNLGIFNYIKIDYKKIASDTSPKLDVFIKMNSKKRHSLSFEGQVTFREGFGGGGIIVYKTKNPFRGLEQLEFRIRGFAENVKNATTNQYIIGTDIGPQLSLRVPSLLFFPKLSKTLIKGSYPKTTISAYFNYQNREEYRRWVFGLNNTYELSETKFKSHKIAIPEWSVSYIDKSSTILKDLSTLSPRLAYSFQDYVNAGLKYSYIYNETFKKEARHPRLLYANFNLTGFGGSLLNYTGIFQKDSSGAQLLGGIRYSKFVKIDADFRKYFNYKHERQLVVRSYAGFAIPFGKGNIAVPFDKLFFTGGANGVRGWKIRSLGPGSSVDTTNIDKLGEIKIELNSEYRFRINSMIKGAVFVDAGNIWRLEDKNEKAVFRFDRFYKELAIAAGAGLRFDFTFLIARIDAGWPIKNPIYNNVWEFHLFKPEINVGIGYPF